MKLNNKQQALIDHLLKFHHATEPTDQEIVEYLSNQSHGTPVSNSNPLMDCQRWKEFTITSLIEECFWFWTMNWGWAPPLDHSIELENDPIFKKALIRIRDKISKQGMLEFFKAHPVTGKDTKAIQRGLSRKYAD